jgi:mannose-6-phosphate isomerase-like protein (cupin superfamily)
MRSSTACCLAAAILLLPAVADDQSGLVFWTAKDLRAYEKSLGGKINEKKIAVQPLSNFGNHWTMITQRRGDGEAEIHDSVHDFFLVKGGEATLVTGGKLQGGRITEPGETRGPSIEGGSKRKITTGDIVHIPAGMPHQLLVEKEFTYFVIKVRQ